MNSNDYDLKSPIWDSLPASVSWMIFNRDKADFSIAESGFQGINEGINYQIILACAAMIEGYFEQTLNFILYTELSRIPKNNSHSVLKSLLNKEEAQLTKATFSNYSSLFSHFLGSTLKDCFQKSDPESWKTISTLFKLRNVLAHGQALNLIVNYSKGTPTAAHIEFKGKFEEILNFYKEKKISPKQSPENTSFKKMFLSNDIADFFYKQAEEFIMLVDKIVSQNGYSSNLNLKFIFKKFLR